MMGLKKLRIFSLFRIERVSKEGLGAFGSNLAPSRLGSVDGFEFLPGRRSIATQNNFWVICGKTDRCLRLVPVSRTNSKVLDVVGGLKRSGDQVKK